MEIIINRAPTFLTLLIKIMFALITSTKRKNYERYVMSVSEYILLGETPRKTYIKSNIKNNKVRTSETGN